MSDDEKRKAREKEELEAPLLAGKWVPAAEALEMASRRDGGEDAKGFLTRAAALELNQKPMLRTKAEKAEASPPVPYIAVRRDRIAYQFWWDGKILVQHWASGFFELQSRHYQDHVMRLTGVQFSLDDLMALGMTVSGDHVEEKVPPKAAEESKRSRGGRKPSNWWPHFATELAVYIHEIGIPDGIGADGQGEIIAAVQKRMSERGNEAIPDRSSIQPVIQAMLDRLRHPAV
ncbi:hypothetical protein QP179_14180 [Sphingomonas aurantiaca]|uniref:hypothetical protein n=1 Tax=Sphingomonas aurantiaca TaxID=185949 RepID=UPI002FE0CEA0